MLDYLFREGDVEVVDDLTGELDEADVDLLLLGDYSR